MVSGFRSSGATISLARPERGATPPLAGLRSATARALGRAAELRLLDRVDLGSGDLDELLSAVEDCARRVAEAIALVPEPVEQHVALLVELRDLRGDLIRRRLASRLEALADIHAALDALRGAASPGEMLARVPETACTHCGFSRCVISRISDGDWIIENAHIAGAPQDAEAYLSTQRGRRTSLESSPAEREMVRRRSSMAVRADDGAHTVLPPGMTSYVGAPVAARGRVIGLLHVDHGPEGRAGSDRLDELTLGAYAEGVGHLYEHVLLVRRLATQHEHVRRMVTSTGVLLDDLAMADIALAGPTEPHAAAPDGVATSYAMPERRVDELLTRRELEVLELMAMGDANPAIAEKLVITEGTVKSHVKHILRKLRASNRAEAIARYLNGFLDGAPS